MNTYTDFSVPAAYITRWTRRWHVSLLLIALMLVGCDSGNNDQDAAELLLGRFEVSATGDIDADIRGEAQTYTQDLSELVPREGLDLPVNDPDESVFIFAVNLTSDEGRSISLIRFGPQPEPGTYSASATVPATLPSDGGAAPLGFFVGMEGDETGTLLGSTSGTVEIVSADDTGVQGRLDVQLELVADFGDEPTSQLSPSARLQGTFHAQVVEAPPLMFFPVPVFPEVSTSD